jgi:hypothetical protein
MSNPIGVYFEKLTIDDGQSYFFFEDPFGFRQWTNYETISYDVTTRLYDVNCPHCKSKPCVNDYIDCEKKRNILHKKGCVEDVVKPSLRDIVCNGNQTSNKTKSQRSRCNNTSKNGSVSRCTICRNRTRHIMHKFCDYCYSKKNRSF